MTKSDTTRPAVPGALGRVVGHFCHDCGKLGDWPLLMNTTVSGDYQCLCPDCRDQNDPDDVMQQPCPHCNGSGTEWEGWNCEHCDGDGTIEF